MDAELAYQMELELQEWAEEQAIDQVNLELNTIEQYYEAVVSEYSLTYDDILWDRICNPLFFDEKNASESVQDASETV
jgi:hypothetical protein